jgi:hypothetical protein
MTLPIVASHVQVVNPVLRKVVTATLCTVDIAAPITLIVVGILGIVGTLTLPPAAYWSMVGLGASLALFSIISWVKYLCRQNQPLKDSAWAERVHISCRGDEREAERVIRALKDISPDRATYQRILLFYISNGMPCVFFDAGDGQFREQYDTILKNPKEKILVIFCPADDFSVSFYKDSSVVKQGIEECQSRFRDISDRVTIVCISRKDVETLNGGRLPDSVKSVLGLLL